MSEIVPCFISRILKEDYCSRILKEDYCILCLLTHYQKLILRFYISTNYNRHILVYETQQGHPLIDYYKNVNIFNAEKYSRLINMSFDEKVKGKQYSHRYYKLS